MGAKTGIEWTDATWSPIRYRVREDAADIARAKGYTSLVHIAEKMAGRVGQHCEHVSAGCEHCYAETNNHRCLPANGTGLPYDRRSRDLVEPYFDSTAISKIPEHPPRKIFVENQSDIFAEWVPDTLICDTFQDICDNPQHTYQMLTKRAERAFRFLSQTHLPCFCCQGSGWNYCVWDGNGLQRHGKPYPNVWLGISAENQETLDARALWLLKTPAAVRFLSLEPLLGPVDVKPYVEWERCGGGHRTRDTRIDWVIVGGESGHGARPMHPDWVRSIRDQCQAAGVAFFFKQWGAYAPITFDDRHGANGNKDAIWIHPDGFTSPRGEVRDFGWPMAKIRKKAAGRLVDGREWNEFPEVRNADAR